MRLAKARSPQDGSEGGREVSSKLLRIKDRWVVKIK